MQHSCKFKGRESRGEFKLGGSAAWRGAGLSMNLLVDGQKKT